MKILLVVICLSMASTVNANVESSVGIFTTKDWIKVTDTGGGESGMESVSMGACWLQSLAFNGGNRYQQVACETKLERSNGQHAIVYMAVKTQTCHDGDGILVQLKRNGEVDEQYRVVVWKNDGTTPWLKYICDKYDIYLGANKAPGH